MARKEKEVFPISSSCHFVDFIEEKKKKKKAAAPGLQKRTTAKETEWD